jgi:hypothetical protein
MMRTQKNWFKAALMTLAAVGLMIGTFTFSASAQEGSTQTGYPPSKQKDGDYKIVILYNQFEAGKYVKVDGLELLCVPTHKEIYEHGKQKDDGKPTTPPEHKFDHLACYKVFDHYDHDKQY